MHGRRDGQGHLEPAAGPEVPLNALQAGRFELETDGEEKHDDADLGHDIDRRRVLDQGQAAGADQNAGQEEADDGGQPQLVGEEDDDDGSGQNDDELGEHVQVHVESLRMIFRMGL